MLIQIEKITLSKTSKMPCKSFSTSPANCVTGAKLARIKGSVCHSCYARKGFYYMPSVKAAHARNLLSLEQPDWVDRMEQTIGAEKNPHFRWHDAGDVQHTQHLENIAEIARRLPLKRFWLPTKELTLVLRYLRKHGAFPANLTVRVSAYMVDGPAPSIPLPVSTVRSKHGPVPVSARACPAPSQGGACGECRACWDPTVREINYEQH